MKGEISEDRLRIAVFTPSSAPDRKKARVAKTNLKKLGFSVQLSPYALGQRDLSSGSDVERFNDFRWALLESDARVLMPSRGGYGIIRVLDKISQLSWQNSDRVLVGFSDLTFVLNFVAESRALRVFHGPMLVNNFFDPVPQVVEYFERMCGGESYFVKWEGDSCGSRFSGKVFGGNLTCFTMLAGTPFCPNLRDSVLFIEDVHEEEYRVDRLLYTLKHLGVFQDIRGVLVGFSDIGYRVYVDFFRKNGIPFSTGFPGGHGVLNYPIPFGTELGIDFSKNTLFVHAFR